MQEPRLVAAPTPDLDDDSVADVIIDLAASCGLRLDPWQQLVLRRSLVEQPSGLWQSADVAVVCSRQNGKNAILEARLLGGLFVLDEPLIIHTAHEMKAAATTFQRMERFIRTNRSLLKRVAAFSHSKGGESISLKDDGPELRFLARTGGSGRSFSADLLILDEAYNLPNHVMNAITPTLGAKPNPQVWYTSSAVNQIEQPHGLTLARLRRRALKGGDPRLAYFEWSADEDAYREAADQHREREFAADRSNWAVANPSLGLKRKNGTGLTEEFLESQLARLGPAGFAAEHLSVGDWPEEPTTAADEVVPRDRWAQLVNRLSRVAPYAGEPGLRVFTVTANERVATIGVAGYNEDGAAHIEVVDERRGVAWVVDRVAELAQRWTPAAVIIDPASTAGQLIVPIDNALKPLNMEVTKVTARDYAQACGAFYTAVVERPDPKEDPAAAEAWKPTLAHLDDPRINYGLEHATTRPLMGAWVWGKETAPALIAVTLAFHGLAKYGQDQPTESWGFYS